MTSTTEWTIQWDDDAPEPLDMADFLRVNADDDEIDADSIAAVPVGGSIAFGGGAAPVVTLRRAGPEPEAMHFDLRDLLTELEPLVMDAPDDADGRACAEVFWDSYVADKWGRVPSRLYLPALAAAADVLLIQRWIARSEVLSEVGQ